MEILKNVLSKVSHKEKSQQRYNSFHQFESALGNYILISQENPLKACWEENVFA